MKRRRRENNLIAMLPLLIYTPSSYGVTPKGFIVHMRAIAA
jgi:hypothetical protein